MKYIKIGSLFCLPIIGILLWIFFTSAPKDGLHNNLSGESVVKKQNETINLAELDKKKPIYTTDFTGQITYSNLFSVRMGVAKNIDTVKDNQLKFKLAFKKVDKTLYRAVLYGVESVFTNKNSSMITTDTPALGFTVKRSTDGQISDVNLLGLADDHPYAIVKHVVTQLSFKTDGSDIKLSLIDGTYHYRYISQTPNKIIRKLINIKPLNAVPDMVFEHEEDWFVDHVGTAWPQKMDLNLYRKVDVNGQKISFKEHILSTLFEEDELDYWSNEALFSHNANITLVSKGVAPKQEGIVITDLSGFNQALFSLDSRLDPQLAIAIGQYLLAHHSLDEVFEFLMDEDRPTQHHSHMIYALQKAGTLKAENYLNEIANNIDLTKQNRTRAVVSSGQFKNATETSVNNLNNLMDDDEEFVADAAMLNLGTMSKNSPKLKQQIGDILLDRLENEADPYMAILAISNTNNPIYDENVLPYLQDSRFYIRSAAFSIIARRSSYQSIVLNALLKEQHPSVIDTIAKTIVKYENTPVPNVFMSHLRKRIVSPGAAVTISRLLKFYLALKLQFQEVDLDFLISLKDNPNISNTSLQMVDDYLKSLGVQ
jgi:hypothetical protein